MFLHLSIILSGGCLGPGPGGRLGGLAWGCLDPGPGGGLWGLAGGGIQAHTWGVSRPTFRGVSRTTPGEYPGPDPEGCIPACTEADTPPPADGYYCGRYASYWIAFLFTRSLSCSPRTLQNHPGIDLENVCLLRTPEDANRIANQAKGKHVVVIGTSFIGKKALLL